MLSSSHVISGSHLLISNLARLYISGGHINHNGDPTLRAQLYIGALTALRSNTECRACYNRLKENGKPGKVAVVAVANKLIRQAFAVVTQGVPYEDGHVSKLHSASANVTA